MTQSWWRGVKAPMMLPEAPLWKPSSFHTPLSSAPAGAAVQGAGAEGGHVAMASTAQNRAEGRGRAWWGPRAQSPSKDKV